MFEMDFVSNKFGTKGNFVLTDFPDLQKSDDIESQEQGRKLVTLMLIGEVISMETAGKLLRQMEVLTEFQETADLAWELFEAIRTVSTSPSARDRDGVLYIGIPTLSTHPELRAHLC
jgi:hypothetical protein